MAPRRIGLGRIPRVLRYILRGEGQERAPDIVYGHDLDRIEVRSDRPLPFQVDGEDLGDAAEVLFEAEREAVSILAPGDGTLTA